MTNPNPHSADRGKSTKARRVTLLASTAGLGALLLLGAPYAYVAENLSMPPAHAEEAAMPHPVSFADLVAKVKPAVISVRVKIDNSTSTNQNDGNSGMQLQPGSPMEKFFQQFGFENLPNGTELQRHQIITGVGSGFFISPDGYAVTNNHVVDHAKSVQVTTSDGTNYTAKVIGTDPKTDIALIKIDSNKNDFSYVQFADHEPRVGDWVVAVGNPYGLGGTVTAGIVSAGGRDIGDSTYGDYLQIDAPINKGNSGGPAFNVDGKVIGINTAIYSPSGGSVGIGFDVPAETAKMVVAQLKEHGHVDRGWLGIEIQPVTAGIASSLGMQKAAGAMVDSLHADGPAAKAGLKSGDVITAVNGTPVKNASGLSRQIGVMAPNSSVKLDVLRNGETKTLTATLGQMPNQNQTVAENDQTAPNTNIPHLGLMLKPASEVAGSGDQGVVVMSVDPDGRAAQQGVRTGDVILDVGGKAVGSAGDVRQALIAAKSQGKHDALMKIKKGGETRFVAIPLGQVG